MATGAVEKSLTATGQTDWLQVSKEFNVSVDFTTGSGSGTVVLERSFDGSNAKPGALESYTADAEKVGESPEDVYYRLRCTAYTSGTIALRLSY